MNTGIGVDAGPAELNLLISILKGETAFGHQEAGATSGGAMSVLVRDAH